MRIAILGSLKPTTTYLDWSTSIRLQLLKFPVSEIIITGGNTILNRYVKHCAESLAIQVKEYNINESTDYMQAKLTRNQNIIRDSDMVVVFVDEQMHVDKKNVDKKSTESNKRAIIINISKQLEQTKCRKNMIRPQEVKREELVTLEEELELIKKIKQSPDNCEAAKEKLILVNQRFIRVIVDRYATEKHPAEELIEEGIKGLLRAVKKYDEIKGFKFISYAQYWIKESIKKHINNNMDFMVL